MRKCFYTPSFIKGANFIGAFILLPLTGWWDKLQPQEEIEKRRKSKYYNLSLPWKLVDVIDHFIDRHPELGYVSRGEIVREAIRQWLLSLENSKILSHVSRFINELED